MKQLQGKVLIILELIQSDLEIALGKETVSGPRRKDGLELEQREIILKDLLKTHKEKYGKTLEDISSIH